MVLFRGSSLQAILSWRGKSLFDTVYSPLSFFPMSDVSLYVTIVISTRKIQNHTSGISLREIFTGTNIYQCLVECFVNSFSFLYSMDFHKFSYYKFNFSLFLIASCPISSHSVFCSVIQNYSCGWMWKSIEVNFLIIFHIVFFVNTKYQFLP